MAVRELLRPLPLVLIILFAAVAVTDIVHSVREEKPPPPDLLVNSTVDFTARDTGLEAAGTAPEGKRPDKPQIVVDADRDRVVIHTSGTLRIPFVLDDRTDALRVRYNFSGGSGRADLQIARPEGSGSGLDSVIRRTVSAEQRKSGRIRVPLHGRRGEFVLQIDVELGPGPGRLRLGSVTLVKEGDPARRQR
jgi:hypothetical protein